MTNPRTAPNKALQLLQDAKQARIVRVDLERGVMTMTLPDGLQVSRDPLALVPVALVAVAEAEAPELGVIFKTDSPSSFRPLDWLDGGYEANHQGAEYNVYRRHTNKDGQERRDGPYWHAYITREDSEGLSWHTSIGPMVVNDFGVLVRVAKGWAMTYRVTHVDMHHRRRRVAVRNVANRQAAIAWVEQLYGLGWYVAAIRTGAF